MVKVSKRRRSSKLLDKNIDVLCVGHDLQSMILSTSLLGKGQRVLVLNDQKMRLGEGFIERPRQLELEFLRVFGQADKITPLIEIERYCQQRPYFVRLGEVSLALGLAPHQNLIELARKFPRLFQLHDFSFVTNAEAQAEFDELYQVTLKRLAASAHQFQGGEQLNFQLFLTQCPNLLRELFGPFEAGLSKVAQRGLDPEDEVQVFLYFFRSLFHFRLDQGANSMELFHLFLSLLSPQYQIDQGPLLADLEEIYLDRQGQFKTTSIREWKFDGGRPWSVELASFDGIIHPHKISLHSSLIEHIPLELECAGEIYRAAEFTWTLERELDLGQGEWDLYCVRLKHLGTSTPWWHFKARGKQAVFRLPVLHQKADKLAFRREALQAQLKTDLEEVFHYQVTGRVEEQVHFTHETWLGPKPDAELLGPSEGVQGIRESHHLTEPKRLRQVSYFGPLGRGQLGLFSSLMNLREAQLYF